MWRRPGEADRLEREDRRNDEEVNWEERRVRCRCAWVVFFSSIPTLHPSSLFNTYCVYLVCVFWRGSKSYVYPPFSTSFVLSYWKKKKFKLLIFILFFFMYCIVCYVPQSPKYLFLRMYGSKYPFSKLRF